MSTDSLITAWRPKSFDEVIGQDEVVKSFRRALDDNTSHSFLFTGPPGTGKTTIARLGAKYAGTNKANLTEVDAATYSGVDDMRSLTATLGYHPLGKNSTKSLIIDECFAPFTMVSTVNGPRRIDSIKIGDMVYSATGLSRVCRVFRKKVDVTRVVLVCLSNNVKIVCTEDHLFLTANGWCRAGDLYSKELICEGAELPSKLLGLWDRIQGEQCNYKMVPKLLLENVPGLRDPVFEKRERYPGNLLKIVRYKVCAFDPSIQHYVQKVRQWFHKQVSRNLVLRKLLMPDVSGMRNYIYGDIHNALQTDVFCQMRQSISWTKKKRSERKAQRSNAPSMAREARSICEYEACCITTNDGEESGPSERGCGKNNRNQKKKWNFAYLAWTSRWKWKIDSAAKLFMAIAGMQGRVFDTYGTSSLRQFWFSNKVYRGFSFSRGITSNRGGWAGTPIGSQKRDRPKKRSEIAYIRVDCVSRYECRDRFECERSGEPYIEGEEGFTEFWDLQIEGHPSYIANGVMVHNCHSISKQGWQSLLKMIEEPPSWVMWFLCTTEIAKVPDSIRSRCACYILKPLRVTELFDYLLEIAAAENFKTPRPVIELCAKMADGAPRKALSNLAVCYAAKDRAEAAKLIADMEASEEGTPYALARAIADGWKWDRVQPLLASLAEADENPEGIRHTIRAYFTKIILGTKDAEAVCRALRVLDNFAEPCNAADGLSPIIIAVGRSLF